LRQSTTLEENQMSFRRSFAVAATLLAVTGVSQSALINRGGGMIYDSTRNITWLADMNYAFTSGYAAANVGGSGSNQIQSNGRMGWDAASQWADQLEYGGFGDWRLPTLNPVDTSCNESFDPGGGFPLQYGGWNCTGGELTGLFVADLGYNANGSGVITSDDTAEQIANQALFSNVQPEGYWSGTVYAPEPLLALAFFPGNGVQTRGNKTTPLYAVAVRRGDVPSTVPEPQTLALALVALVGGMVAMRRRRPG
jgi:hypothetical protein